MEAGNPSVESGRDLVIADPNILNSESIAWCIKGYGIFRSVECVRTVPELLESVRSRQPALVVVAAALVVVGIRELSSELAVRMGETRVAVFGDQLTDRQLDLVSNNRISGLLSRQESVRPTCDHLTRIVAGTPVLSATLQHRVTLDADGTFRCTGSDRLQQLTDRQWDVLIRIAEGRRVPDVAAELKISKKAVEGHKHRIMQRLGATDRVDLCRWAIREGLITA